MVDDLTRPLDSPFFLRGWVFLGALGGLPCIAASFSFIPFTTSKPDEICSLITSASDLAFDFFCIDAARAMLRETRCRKSFEVFVSWELSKAAFFCTLVLRSRIRVLAKIVEVSCSGLKYIETQNSYLSTVSSNVIRMPVCRLVQAC